MTFALCRIMMMTALLLNTFGTAGMDFGRLLTLEASDSVIPTNISVGRSVK